MLVGGEDDDAYKFIGSFGKDTIIDSDGKGSIKLGQTTLTGGEGSGKRNIWTKKLDDGQVVVYELVDSASSSTGKKLVISKEGDTANTITIDHFDFDKATGSEGYLGIKLSGMKIALKEGSGANVWSDLEFKRETLDGKSTDIPEATAKLYTIYLGSAAKAGDTITLALSGGSADKFKVGVAGSEVAANGAVFTLLAGQTEVRFSLLQEGEVTANGNASLSASYQSGSPGSATVTSNAWNVNLVDGGAITNEANEADDGNPGGYGPGADHYVSGSGPGGFYGAAGNDFMEGGDFSDAFYGGPGHDRIHGGGGQDFLYGGDEYFYTFLYPEFEGNWFDGDFLDGGDGNDLVMGDWGDDYLKGGSGDDLLLGLAGNDVIYGEEGDDDIYSDYALAPWRHKSTA